MNAARFDSFIDSVKSVIGRAAGDEAQILAGVEPLVRDLVAHDAWLDDKYAQPHPQYYQQYRLYACPEDSFSVVSFVWGPGQQTPVHDHTVWGGIGVLRGAEIGDRYERQEDGRLVKTESATLKQGMTECVSPTIGEIHKVSNALTDQVSISIHVYGADIGKVRRHVFNAETGEVKEFISGYAN